MTETETKASPSPEWPALETPSWRAFLDPGQWDLESAVIAGHDPEHDEGVFTLYDADNNVVAKLERVLGFVDESFLREVNRYVVAAVASTEDRQGQEKEGV